MTDPQNPGRGRVGAAENVSIPQQTTRETALDADVGTSAVAGERRSGTESWRDRVRWGPVWAGATVVLPVFLVLQLLALAFGWLRGGAGAGVVSAILGLIAFFVGGMLAAATTSWRGTPDGLLHGVMVWALGVLGILFFALIGGTSVLGPLAAGVAQTMPEPPTVDPAEVLSTARITAGWTALGLGLSVAAAAIGGVVGSKMWPPRKVPPGQQPSGAEGR